MQSQTTLNFVQRACRVTNLLLWTVGAAALLFVVISIPKLREAQSAAERALKSEISDENRAYCEKWGMKFGTHEHTLCTQDLNEIRAKHEKRMRVDDGIL